MAAISLRGIEKRYGDVVVVKRLDLDIADGELVVLVGPSGCGKSTTLRMIAGLETITSGELSIDGKRCNDVAPGDRDLAMVFQSYALYPHMSVRDNIAFSLKVRGVGAAEIEARIADAAGMLGLGALLDRKPKALSGGQRQRVAMARAIVRRPKAFLFDEPLSNLDAKLRTEVRAEIAAVRRRFGTTTVYVTHDQVEAMTLADRVVVLEGGVVQQVGPPLSLYDKPKNRFVATFLGTPTMNVLPVEVWAKSVTSTVPGGAAHVGVRPHDLRPIETAGQRGLSLVVAHVERLGHETVVYGDVERVRIAALARPDVKVGDSLVVTAAREALHFFDAQGDRIDA